MITTRDIELCNKVLLIANRSNADKRKVGAIIYDEQLGKKLIHGYNTRVQENLKCENNDGITFDDVIHAEEYAIMQAMQHHINVNGKTLYCTYSPCMNCCKLIVQSGIKRVVYINQHATNFTEPAVKGGLSPYDFLRQHKVVVDRCEQLVKIEGGKTIIVHHDSDNDGKMSGWLLKNIHKDAQVFGYNYQKHAEWMDVKDVTTYIFGDVTPHLNWVHHNINRINSGDIKVIIYDHHVDRKNKIDKIDERGNIYWEYQNDIGACEIIKNVHSTTLRKFCHSKDMNYNILSTICKYLALYDVWAFTDKKYKECRDSILGLDIYLKSKGYLVDDFNMEVNRCLSVDNHFINLMSEYNMKMLKSEVLRSNIGMIEKGMIYETEPATIFMFQGSLKNYWIEEQIPEYCLDKFGKEPEILLSYNIRLEEGIITFSARSRNMSALKFVKHIAGEEAGGHPNASGMSLPLAKGFEFIKHIENQLAEVEIEAFEL